MKKILLLLIFFLFAIPVQAKEIKATLINPKHGTKVVVISGSQEAKIFFGKGYILFNGENLGSYAPTTNFDKRLTKSLTSAGTTIYVSSVSDRDGKVLPLSSTNKGYFTIEPGSVKEESVVCSGADSSAITLTSCTRGLLASGSSETGSSTLAFAHNAGSRIIMTNISQFYSNFVDLFNSQTVGGAKSFTGQIDFGDYLPTATTTAPTANNQISTKKYVDDTAVAGAPDATYTVKGNVEIATSSEFAIGTRYGGTGANLIIESRSVASTTSSKTIIPATKSNGKLSQGFLDLTENFSFTASTTIKDLSVNGDASMGSTTISDAVISNILYLGATSTAPLMSKATTSLHYHPYFYTDYNTDTTLASTTALHNATRTITASKNVGFKPMYYRAKISLNASTEAMTSGSDISGGGCGFEIVGAVNKSNPLINYSCIKETEIPSNFILMNQYSGSLVNSATYRTDSIASSFGLGKTISDVDTYTDTFGLTNISSSGNTIIFTFVQTDGNATNGISTKYTIKSLEVW